MIAFAYCDTGPKRTALYTALAEGLVANIKQVMPKQQIMMLTDDETPIIPGIHHVLRIKRSIPLMVWRLKAHQMAHSMADEIVFTEPDVRFVEDITPDFMSGIDIAVTTREQEVTLDNKRLNTPFTLGMTFSRSADFWRDAKLYCQSLDDKDKDWFGDMLSIAHVIQNGMYNVVELDGAIYNHVVNDPFKPVTAKVLHYKGKRKSFLFDSVVEA